jgi:hypothetical protein
VDAAVNDASKAKVKQKKCHIRQNRFVLLFINVDPPY